MRFEFRSGVCYPLVHDLQAGKYDIVFCTEIDTEKNIEFIPVAKQNLVLIVPWKHPLANRYTVDLTEVAPYPQVYFSLDSALRITVDKLFAKVGTKPHMPTKSRRIRSLPIWLHRALALRLCPAWRCFCG